jgi:3-deoxy-7-phosphoheptulonate synthase
MSSPAAKAATHNVNVASLTALDGPRTIKARLPASESAQGVIVESREVIKAILRGEDPRMLVVVGPCSIHDVKAAREYAQRLASLSKELAGVYVVMRVYFEKPRTTVGWKGLINDPHLDGSFDMAHGIELARDLLRDVAGLGLPTATEFLDPITPQYLDDLVSWAAIGARTTESQTHRQMASGLSMPVGFKNSTDGNLQVALDAMKSAQSGHHFLGIDDEGRTAVVATRGNPWGHLILRGGGGRTNYETKDVAEAETKLRQAGLPAGLMVDCSHANSGKKHERQEVVWKSIVQQRAEGDTAIVGAMVESNLFEGSQALPAAAPGSGDIQSQLQYGVSVTDACIGWDKTEQMLRGAAAVLG